MIANARDLIAIDFGWFRLGNASAYTASRTDLEFSFLAAGDLNADGNDDLVLAARFGGNPLVGGENKVVILFYDPTVRNFVVKPEIQAQLEVSLYPRRASIADFNGDGRLDLFVGDHGVDGKDIGFPNRLYLQTATGFRSAAPPGGMPTDYSHGLITADFTGDGLKDLLVINQFLADRAAGSTSRSYLLSFDGGSTVTQRWIAFDDPQEVAFSTLAPYTRELTVAQRESVRQYLGGTAADFNRDGVPDLLLIRVTSWQEDHQLVLFESAGPGRYKAGHVLPTSQDYDRALNDPTKLQLIAEAVPYDIDADGTDEVIIARAYLNTGGWQTMGLFMQAVKRAPDGSWDDITAQVFPQNYPHVDANGRWPATGITKIDLNGDGRLDLLLTSGTGDSIARESSASYWVFDGQRFSTWNPMGLKLGNDWGWMPTVVRVEGQTLVLGTGMQWSGALQGYLPAQEALTIRGWRVARPVEGTSGDDSFTADDRISEIIHGSTGHDVVRFSGPRTDYRLGWNDGVWSLTRKGVVDGADLLVDVETLQFSGSTLTTASRAHGGFGDLPASVYQFFILAFGAAPGVEYLQQCADAFRGGADVRRITNVFTSKNEFLSIYPAALSNAEMASKLVTNVVGTSAMQAARDEAVRDITGALDNGLSRGDMIFTVFSNLAALQGDTKWGGTAQLFFNQIAVAKVYTETMNQSTTDRATLAAAIAAVTAASDVSSEVAIVTLIGQGLMAG